MENKDLFEDNNDIAFWLLLFLFFPLDKDENIEEINEQQLGNNYKMEE